MNVFKSNRMVVEGMRSFQETTVDNYLKNYQMLRERWHEAARLFLDYSMWFSSRMETAVSEWNQTYLENCKTAQKKTEQKLTKLNFPLISNN